MTKILNFALGFSALLAFVGCYNTNGIKNGGLVCGTGATCPTGFVCKNDGTPGHCWQNGTGPSTTNSDAATADTPAVKPDADLGQGCTAANATPPYGPFSTCSTSQTLAGSTCDPVCQSGCPCNHRCILNDQTSNSFMCEATAPASGTAFIPPLGVCDSSNVGLCAPGSVCLSGSPCPNLCYKTCRTDDDCGQNSRCTATTITGAANSMFLCSPPIETCNPTGAAACGTARANFSCVFLAGLTGVANIDSAVCDCSTLHYKALGEVCTLVPDNCKPGLACVSGTCRTVCNRSTSASACPSGGGCTQIYGSATYGYCK